MTNPVKLTIALAGNANVGKSVIFNYLTGLHQHIGNWPGKTVEKAEGTLHFKGYEIDIVDLPGIYSLSTFSMEELISREYIISEKPNLVVNVVDASLLERCLFFTIQLMELETPMIIALNQVDIASRKGIKIDHEKLSEILGVPVIPTIATKGKGIYELLDVILNVIENDKAKPRKIKYGREVEEKIEIISKMLLGVFFRYPPRWTAIKLLEGDKEVEESILKVAPEIVTKAKELAQEIEQVHGHSCFTVMASERYNIANSIAREVQVVTTSTKLAVEDRLHNLTTHKALGYLVMLGVIASLFYSVFLFGNFTSALLSDLLKGFEPAFEAVFGYGYFKEIIFGGVFESLVAGIAIALPYLVPFYFLLYMLEDSGYLSRIAFLMDSAMHKIGLHGKAFIPVILSYGCNVPACLGCRIMETERERILATFIVTLIPCAARSVIILGLVGKYISIEVALALYAMDLSVVLLLGRVAFRFMPGEPTGLIMEMHEYRMPHIKTVASQTWFRVAEYAKMALPLIVLSGLLIKSIEVLGFLKVISFVMSPVTTAWLGLPPEVGISLIFGILRKELALVMLTSLLGTSNFGSVLTPLQMIVFTTVMMFYIPCVATIAALVKELGLKKAALITVSEVLFAVMVGGILLRVLPLLGLH
ncbi:MAG: ferrous iron transport protein B [Candidatus Bathyarchaeia archaeon]